MLATSLLLALSLVGQELHLPTKPVPLGRQVIMNIDKPTADNYDIEWIVIDRGNIADPLDSYLFVDSSKLRALLPTGMAPTSVNVNVVISSIDNGKIVTKLLRGEIAIGDIPPVPVPPIPPGPTPPGPTPGPTPDPPPAPAPTPVLNDGKYKLAKWTFDQVNGKQLDKSQIAAMATKFTQVADMIGNGAFAPVDAVNAINSGLTDIIKPNKQAWIDVYLQPLRDKLNSLNYAVKTVQDQAVSYREIAEGLNAAAK